MENLWFFFTDTLTFIDSLRNLCFLFGTLINLNLKQNSMGTPTMKILNINIFYAVNDCGYIRI
jgi:hypothetical protein